MSTFVSIATLQYYNFNGVLPGYDSLRTGRPHPTNIDPDKAAFSTAPADEDGHYAPVGMNDDEPEFNASPYGGASMAGPGSSTMPHDPYEANTYEPNAYEPNTSYGGAAAGMGTMGSRYGEDEFQSHPPATGPQMYSPPAAHELHEDSSSVHFPTANYDRIGLRQV